jgi:hypothetical protein
VAARTVTTADELVRKAAETCGDARRILTELFPDVFRPRVRVTRAPLLGSEYDAAIHVDVDGNKFSVAVRSVGKYAGKGIFIDKRITAACAVSIDKDEHGETVIVFTPKETQ